MKKVTLVPYDSTWPSLFSTEAMRIQEALGDTCVAVHHVGSTAVPDLASKPTIDIIAEVSDLTSFNDQKLIALNYEYKGGFNLPFRKGFSYRTAELKINLHVFEKNDPEIELNLLFRDYLRMHSEARDQYTALKYKLLEDEAAHEKKGSIYRGYTLGKNAFIQNILKEAGFNRCRMVICTHIEEWNVATQFRNQYFFHPNKIEDPYTWTFEHKDHQHLILYKGVDMVGYAHIQLWPENRAAIRIIVVDEKERGKHYGETFMALIEKWLKLEGYKSLHTESSPAAVGFYRRLCYQEMPFNDPDGYEGGPEDIAMGKLL